MMTMTMGEFALACFISAASSSLLISLAWVADRYRR